MITHLRPAHSLGRWPNPAVLGHARLDCAPTVSRHPGALKLLAYCRSKTDGEGPCRQDMLRPSEIVRLLPYLFIVEPSNGDWRYRLGGTELVDRLGTEFTGKSVHEVFEADSADMVVEAYNAVAYGGVTFSARGHLLVFGVDQGSAETVHVPMLARDGRTVLVFGGVFFD